MTPSKESLDKARDLLQKIKMRSLNPTMWIEECDEAIELIAAALDATEATGAAAFLRQQAQFADEINKERKLTDKMAETLELIGKAFEGNWCIDWGVIDEVLTEYKKARGEE